jgi:hypothetical protein
MSSSRTNLVICPVGRPDSLHRQWVASDRTYDLLLINYSKTPGLYAEDADLYHEGQGFKLELIVSALEAYQGRLSRYDAVWLPDDDLAIPAETVEQLFRLFAEFGLTLAQPAISNFNGSHPETIRRFYTVLRYGNRVEMMCPLFTAAHLATVLPTFRLNRSGWGVEWLWSAGLPADKVAVIDRVAVRHTKAIERDGPYYSKLSALGIDPEQEETELLERYGIPGTYREFGLIFRPGWTRLSLVRPALEALTLLPFRALSASRPLRQRLGIRRRKRQ